MELFPAQQMALFSLCALYILLAPHHFLHAEKVLEGSCCGYSGVPGTPGHNGLPGRDGKDGEAGPKGEKGDTGKMGPQGPPGKHGPTGPAGAAGVAGRTGPAGAVGPTGPKGSVGPVGQKGERGLQGPPGPLPPINLVELQLELQTLKDSLNKITKFYFSKRVGRKYFVTDKKSGKFDEALKVCSTVSGVPAMPRSQEENQALVGILSASEYAWLSANDRKTEGKFVDSQDKSFQFSSWKSGEPNNHKGVEDCAFTDSTGKWNDVNCNSNYIIICEI